MSEFYHKPSTNIACDSGENQFSAATQAFLDFAKKENVDLLFAQLRINNMVVDDYMTHPLKTRLNVFTVSEGFVAVAAGIAIDEGLIKMEERLCDSFPEYISEQTSEYLLAVTVHDLLTMTTGLAHPLFICDDEERYTVKDWVRYFFEAEFVRMPGIEFVHSNFNTYMLSCLIEKKAGVNLLEYLRDRLFEPIGIGNPDWLTCPKGHIMGANGLYLTVEEMGRFGQLIRYGGELNGHRIVSESFIKSAITKQVKTGVASNNGINGGYGYHFWISNVPNCVMLKGRFGQCIVISLDKDAIFTFQALEGYKYQAMFDKAVEIIQLI